MLVDGVRECKRQAWNDEQRHAVAGEVHPFPRSAGCQEDGSGGALELPQDLRAVPAHDKNGNAAFELIETFTDGGHILVRSKKDKGVSVRSLQQTQNLPCDSLGIPLVLGKARRPLRKK